MDRQRAIKILQKLQADYNDQYIDYEGANDAYKMAISALQKIDMLEKLTETHKQSGHAPTRTISMEDLRGLLNDTGRNDRTT